MPAWGVISVLVGTVLLVVYYVYLVRAILEMLGREVSAVLLTFSFLALIPGPLLIIMGILVIIIWSKHKARMSEA